MEINLHSKNKFCIVLYLKVTRCPDDQWTLAQIAGEGKSRWIIWDLLEWSQAQHYCSKGATTEQPCLLLWHNHTVVAAAQSRPCSPRSGMLLGMLPPYRHHCSAELMLVPRPSHAIPHTYNIPHTPWGSPTPRWLHWHSLCCWHEATPLEESFIGSFTTYGLWQGEQWAQIGV